ncbi:GNAT family N-acetyltransferase [Pseudomonas bohemica]|uniref:GNAT family N-acetyltransferase n=1 Tax=Pseudomonas bohemica TaxID=2044872 RepID=UPI000DA5FB79|nr:GNAT family N-acetyltransferase [Pseudomonas bohemica]
MQRTTKRLILRAPTPDDLDSLFAIYGDPATHQFNPSGPLSRIEQAQSLLQGWLDHWQREGYGQWTITTRERPDQVIGFGGVDARRYLDVLRLNLGYRFGVQAWGQGYATELSQAALAFAFTELQVAEVFAVVRPQHHASIRVLEKAGMHRIDTLSDVPGQTPSLVYRSSRDEAVSQEQ